MAPLEPMVATTRFGTMTPAIQLRSDACGCEDVAGHTVRKLGAVVLVTVTLSKTALAVLGTPLSPPTCRLKVLLGLSVFPSVRVSSIRNGVSGVKNWPPDVAPWK